MDYFFAKSFISSQLKNLSKLNDKRFGWKGYEYKLMCEGSWLCPTVGIYRREIGKRNFKYCTLVDVTGCSSYDSALMLVYDKLGIAFDESGKPYEKHAPMFSNT